MKVIVMKVIARMMASLCIESQEFSIVPFVGAILVFGSASDKAALNAAPYLLAENLENGLYTSLSYQINQDLNIPTKRPLTEMLANYPHNQNEKHPIPLPTNSYAFPFCTNICFLHACTPERLHAERLHWPHPFRQRTDDWLPDTKKHILQKMLGVLKRWVTIRAVEQVNPTAQNT